MGKKEYFSMTSELLDALQASLSLDATAFLPELALCGAIVMLLLIRLIPYEDALHLGWFALVASLAVCWLGFQQWIDRTSSQPATVSTNLFGGMLIFDNFAVFLKLFLYTFLPLVVFLCLLTGIPDREDSADFFCLLFGSTLGMSVMASSNHLLMVFIGVEMASLPSYAMAGFLKGRRQSSEAALKYVVYGGGASGVMLYGISLVAGYYGTGYLPEVVRMVAVDSFTNQAILLGMLFILIGIGFKLAAFPFHFWCPDVFEGAAAEVGAFLSVASKGAALALLARVSMGLGGLTVASDGQTAPAIDFDVWSKSVEYLVPVLSIFAIVTTTFGNLAAYGQTNLKRLLAYSTIAHAGFMMMGLATMTSAGAGAMLFYLITYLFMNLGAFTVVAFMRNLTGHEDLSYFRGFIYRSPLLVIMLAVFLLSLLGLPPLAGFAAKFQIFRVLFDAAQEYARRDKVGLSYTMYALLIAGGLNTVLSLFYYVKVLKVMVLEKTLEEVENRPVAQVSLGVLHSAYVSLIAAVVLALGMFWDPLFIGSDRAVNCFRALPASATRAAALTPQGGD
jgi:NADH-quinone oxidoreductase subunit N